MMKAKVFRMIIAVACCSLVFAAGCGKEEKNISEAKPQKAKVIRMATEATFPPYEYFENGKIKGIDVDIVTEVATNLGYKLEIMDMKFDSVILSVQSGKTELAASGITVTEERKQKVNFTIPYVTAAQVIIVAKESKLTTPEDLKDAEVRIGVQQGTTGDNYVAQNLHEPQRFDNAGLAVAALVAGKVDVVVCDSEPAKIHVSKHPELHILPTALTSEVYAFALNKKDVELLKGFNAELLKMRKSGRLQEILDKYMNNKDAENKTDK